MFIKSFLLLCWFSSSSCLTHHTPGFEELLGTDTFIDKTLFIKTIIEAPSTSTLIVCPNRWGKTTNLQMLKTFLRIEIDQNGNQIGLENSKNYQLFKKGEFVCNGQTHKITLNIAKHEQILKTHLGQYPVVHVDFGTAIDNNYEKLSHRIKLAIGKAYEEHKYLITSPKNITTEDRTRFQKFLRHNVTFNELTDSFEFLSKVLFIHYNKTVWFVIDNYDYPFYSFFKGTDFQNDHINDLLQFFDKLFGYGFINNANLHQAVVFGIYQLGKFAYHNVWNDYIYHSYSEYPDPMLQYFGFKQSDVEVLFQRNNLTAQFPVAREWFNGYSASSYLSRIFFHPGYVLNFVKHKKIAMHLEEKNLDFLDKLLIQSKSLRDSLLSLINNDVVKLSSLWMILSEQNINYLREIHNHDNLTEMDGEVASLHFGVMDLNPAIVYLIDGLLLARGYLTTCLHPGGDSWFEAKIPNQQVAFELSRKLITAYRERASIKDNSLYKLAMSFRAFLYDNTTESIELEKSLQSMFERFPTFDTTNTTYNVKYRDDEFIISTINHIMLKIQYSSNFTVHVFYQRKLTADVVFADNAKGVGAAIEIAFDSDAQNVLKKVNSYGNVLSSYEDILSIKYIGINVLPDKTVKIAASKSIS